LATYIQPKLKLKPAEFTQLSGVSRRQGATMEWGSLQDSWKERLEETDSLLIPLHPRPVALAQRLSGADMVRWV